MSGRSRKRFPDCSGRLPRFKPCFWRRTQIIQNQRVQFSMTWMALDQTPRFTVKTPYWSVFTLLAFLILQENAFTDKWRFAIAQRRPKMWAFFNEESSFPTFQILNLRWDYVDITPIRMHGCLDSNRRSRDHGGGKISQSIYSADNLDRRNQMPKIRAKNIQSLLHWQFEIQWNLISRLTTYLQTS